MDDFTDAYIATQVKVLREHRELNQTQLAELAGMRQSQISELEDVNNRSWKVRTLKKLAKAFDLVLVVRFEPFGKVLPDIGHLERAKLERPSYKDDPAFSHQPALIENEAEAPIRQHVATVLNASGRFGGFSQDVSNVA
jgi:transcriptional regulator with XRE-family HTH domain